MNFLIKKYAEFFAVVLVVGISAYSGTSGCGSGGGVDPDPPVKLNVSPPDGATGVPPDATISVTFETEKEVSEIDIETFTLKTSNGIAVDGSAPYDPASKTATFKPQSNLNYNTTYVSSVSATVLSKDGTIDTIIDHSWTFSTLAVETFLSMELDPAFGIGGKSTIYPGHKIAMASNVLIQSDGKMLLSGYYGDVIGAHDAKLAVIRTDEENGYLDPAFGVGGIAWVDCSSNLGLFWWAKQGLAIQTDGKILVGGECNSKATVFRLNQDGSTDTGFGVNGKTELPQPGYVQLHATVLSLTTQQSGGVEKIIVGGQSESNAWIARWMLARLNSDGSLDNTFAGGAGIIFQLWRFYDEGVIACAVTPDGGIIAYGVSIKDAGPTSADFAVAHYSADGVLDTSFAAGDPAGVAGLAVIDFGFNDWAYDMKVMPDGRIVGGVHVHDDLTGLSDNYGVFRLTADGLPDQSFGTEGKVEIDFGFGLNDMGNAIALLPDGQMILGGEANNGAGGWQNNNFAFVMLDANGNINTHFGTNGFIWTDFAHDRSAALTMALSNVVTNDNGEVESFELFAAGWMIDPASGFTKYAIAKYKSVEIAQPSE